MVSSEAVPFAKTGGLADVVTGLARALSQAGHEVSVILPDHRQFIPLAYTGDITGVAIKTLMAGKTVQAWVRKSRLPNSRVTVYLVDHPGYFDRAGLYGENGTDYPDNAERFIFFSRSAMEVIRAFTLEPDIIHVHDWQTSLIPALLRHEYRSQSGFGKAATVLTIHNLAFQGNFPRECMDLTGLPWSLFTWDQMEFWGHLNLLKSGIVFSEMLTTVSPTYAREITTPEFGWGLEGVLANRGESLVGILNGVDVNEWNPRRDPYLPCQYGVDDAAQGKAICKRQLQQTFGLPVRKDLPLFGLTSRLTEQKGLDLIEKMGDQLALTESQFVILGSGDPHYEQVVARLSEHFPSQFANSREFSEQLAHLVIGGADAYLMPSRFEPCGLTQMYSLMYGTVPLVHAVGGLADTVTNLTEETLANESANGFVFYDYSPEALLGTFRWALDVFQDKETWSKLQRTGMRQDWSWGRSASEYVDVYRRAQSVIG